MQLGENGEFIVQGQTEARVAAHFFIGNGGQGRERFLNMFSPPLPYQKMGWLAFASSRIEDFFQTSDDTQYVVVDPLHTYIAQELIALHCVPSNIFFGSPRLGRRRFLQNRFRPILDALRDSQEG